MIKTVSIQKLDISKTEGVVKPDNGGNDGESGGNRRRRRSTRPRDISSELNLIKDITNQKTSLNTKILIRTNLYKSDLN